MGQAIKSKIIVAVLEEGACLRRFQDDVDYAKSHGSTMLGQARIEEVNARNEGWFNHDGDKAILGRIGMELENESVNGHTVIVINNGSTTKKVTELLQKNALQVDVMSIDFVALLKGAVRKLDVAMSATMAANYAQASA